MIFSIGEFIDVIIMSLGVAFIFMDRFGIQPATTQGYDPIAHYKRKVQGFDLHNLWTACLITAPAVIFHELAHKLVAIGYGLEATFHAAYFWLGFGVLMKLMNTGFIFFVPGYVSHSGGATPLQTVAIAFAGPFLNLVIWAVCALILKMRPRIMKYTTRNLQILAATKYINGFLFIFNMIPLGFFDGAHVMQGLIAHFG